MTLYLLAGLLVIGIAANALVRPVAHKWFIPDAEVIASQGTGSIQPVVSARPAPALSVTAVAAWAAVALPIVWGIWVTLTKVSSLFS